MPTQKRRCYVYVGSPTTQEAGFLHWNEKKLTFGTFISSVNRPDFWRLEMALGYDKHDKSQFRIYEDPTVTYHSSMLKDGTKCLYLVVRRKVYMFCQGGQKK